MSNITPKAFGIRFENNPKIYDFLAPEADGDKIDIGDIVVVETSLGSEIGKVIYTDKKIEKKNPPTQKIIRKATAQDIKVSKELEKDKGKFEKIFKDCVKKNNLDMKLIDTEFSFDKRITFLFAAESRVDFRKLVKDLTSVLKSQIKLKQIGSRDESRYLGGFGQCGRPLCCRAFLGTIESVTMDMARDQNMVSKGSSKISGLCGRLMCCLGFEDNNYKEALKKLPKMGEKIKTKKGIGVIINVDVLRKKAEVELQNGVKLEVDL